MEQKKSEEIKTKKNKSDGSNNNHYFIIIILLLILCMITSNVSHRIRDDDITNEDDDSSINITVDCKMDRYLSPTNTNNTNTNNTNTNNTNMYTPEYDKLICNTIQEKQEKQEKQENKNLKVANKDEKIQDPPEIAKKTQENKKNKKYIFENKEYEHYDKYIWIGDSRTVGMANCVNIASIAKSSMGYYWLTDQTEQIYKLRNYNIIFNFGINDPGNLINYINFYNNMPKDFTDNNKIFIMAVNPVDEIKQTAYGYSSRNNMVEWFNSNMKNNLRKDFYFIDTYKYLQTTGFGTIDGIHYDTATYQKLYNFMMYTITYKKK